jgi:hypothetical protein
MAVVLVTPLAGKYGTERHHGLIVQKRMRPLEYVARFRRVQIICANNLPQIVNARGLRPRSGVRVMNGGKRASNIQKPVPTCIRKLVATDELIGVVNACDDRGGRAREIDGGVGEGVGWSYPDRT